MLILYHRNCELSGKLAEVISRLSDSDPIREDISRAHAVVKQRVSDIDDEFLVKIRGDLRIK